MKGSALRLREARDRTVTRCSRVAEAVVTLTAREFGPGSLQMAAPIDNLATTQMLNGDLIDAEQNYRRAIGIIEQHEGRIEIDSAEGNGAQFTLWFPLFETEREVTS